MPIDSKNVYMNPVCYNIQISLYKCPTFKLFRLIFERCNIFRIYWYHTLIICIWISLALPPLSYIC